MKMLTRRRVGWVLVGLSVIAAIALLASGQRLVSGEVHRTSDPDGTFVESAIMEFHLSYVVTFAAGAAGLVLLLMSGREKSSG